jgi:serine/threonine protein kinase/tetratricopeptide (TPR) repeat protein
MSMLPIDAQSWAELDRLLDEALERPAAEREAWLESLPASSEAMKVQLRDLLSRATAVETGDYLGSLPQFDWPGGDPDQLQPGMEFGPYRLVRELARGGMGRVWLAERVDGLFSRRVALKLPNTTLPSRGLARRMAHEREILATLEHPGIARLYDAGVAPDGQPYLALEYVEGVPIDQYCRAESSGSNVDLRSRLELFLQVAEAVAHAHGRQVIHRDLKPANIFVTREGVVRLLDFGIAKILEEGETPDSPLTQFGGRALTPEYASPEQIVGAPLTVATDIYSLGVVLYELLSGARPYRLERETRGALEDAILRGDPLRPSEVADPSARRHLRGDLDTIVLKAIKKEPGERYASVAELIDDLSRHLQGQPVRARPDSLWYRGRTFVARNRVTVVAAASTVLAFAALTALWITNLRHDPITPPLVSAPRIGVLPVRNLTGDTALDWTRLGLMSMTSQQLRAAGLRVVDDADVARLARDADQHSETAAPSLADTLRRTGGATHLIDSRLDRDGTQYRLLATLSDSHGNNRNWTFAGQDVGEVARRAVAAIATNFNAEASEISGDRFVNEAYARGRALQLQGRCKDAQPLFSAAISEQPALIEPQMQFASCARQLGDPETAEAMLRKLLASPAPGEDDIRRARVLLELGVVLNRTGRIDEADRFYAESEALARRLGEEDLVARVLVNRGIVEEDRSNFALAREHAVRALEVFEQAGRLVVPGQVYALLANLGIDEGRLDDADLNYDRALESFRAAGDLANEAMMLNNQGLLRREQGRLDEAEALHHASGRIRESIGDRPGLGRVQNMLAQVHAARGRFDESLAASDQALAIARETDDRFYEAVTLSSRAEALAGLRRWPEANAAFGESAGLFEQLGNRAYVLQIELRLAAIDLELGRARSARERTERTLAAARNGAQPIAEVEALAMLGDIAERQGDRVTAASHYEAAIRTARAAGHSGDVSQFTIRRATVLLADGNIVAVEPLLEELEQTPESYPLLRLRAAWAAAHGDALGAVDLMRRARLLAGQRWTGADARLLAHYEQAAGGA